MVSFALVLVWLILLGLIRWLEARERLPAHTWQDVLALGALGLAVLGFFWRVVSGQAFMPADGGDLASFLYPTYRFAAETLRAGHLPLWNPHLYGGTPFAADPQSGFLYPIHLLLFLILPELTYQSLEGLALFHFWWMGAGTYLLLRKLPMQGRLSRWAALAGALAMTFSDPMLTHFGNLNLITVASWLPWVLWAFHRSERSGSWRWTALSGLLLGIGTLAGHPQMSFFISLTLVLDTTLYLLLQPQWRNSAILLAAMRLASVVIIASLVAAPVLWPAWELARHSSRATWDYVQSVSYSLSPAQAIGLIVPGFFGRGPQFHWGPWERVEVGYIGLLPLMLAGLAIALRRDRVTWRLSGLALGTFVIALGVYALPHGWLTWLVPGLAQLRAPARLLLVTDLALAGLAALGLDVALQHGSRARESAYPVWKATVALAIALGALALGLYLALIARQDADPAVTLRIAVALISTMWSLGFTLAALAWLAAWRSGIVRCSTLGWIAIALILLDLGSGAYNDLSKQEPTNGFRRTALVQFVKSQPGPVRIDARTGIEAIWQPSAALVHRLDDVWGVANPLILADYERFWEGLGSRSSRLYDFLNAGYVIGRKDIELDWGKFELAFEGDPELNVYRNRAALPRAQIVYRAIAVNNHEQAWEAIHAADFDPAQAVVIEGGEGQESSDNTSTPVEWQSEGPNRIRIIAELTAPGYLVISQAWYPGWQARLETGERLPVLRANYAFQAVPLPSGRHEVTLTFQPKWWWAGLAVSLITTVIINVAMLPPILAPRRWD
ncbi:MAG: hypothetical protein N0A15_14485 [Anaerolineae bacterium]|nr:hypothetical protein [Anaerolineae bacterium]